jgi:hypothetical protein
MNLDNLSRRFDVTDRLVIFDDHAAIGGRGSTPSLMVGFDLVEAIRAETLRVASSQAVIASMKGILEGTPVPEANDGSA